MKRVLILNYHLIDGKIYDFDAFGGIYAVKQNQFELQMSALNDNNIKVVSLNDIVDNKVDEDFCVALTFDDGNPSDFDLVFPILKQYRFTATFFLSIQNIENNGVTWKQYRDMQNYGFNIGSHGITHRDLSKIDLREVEYELKQSKIIIEKNIFNSVRFFSLPFGMYNSTVVQFAKKNGYNAILTTQFNYVYPSVHPFVIDRWSIKRNTSIAEFIRIIQNNKVTVKKYKYISAIKKVFLYSLGSSITNKVYTFKNKLF